MDFEKMTEKVRSFFQAAQTLATRKNHQSLEPEHLLRVMMDDDTALVDTLVRAASGNPDKLKNNLDRAIAKFPSVTGSNAGLRMSNDLAKIADNAQVLAEKSGDKFVTTERLLQAINVALDQAQSIAKGDRRSNAA